MSRQYGSRQASTKKNKASQLLIALGLGFLLGYLFAFFVKTGGMSQWVNTQVQAFKESKPQPPQTPKHVAKLPPKPKFEFYTLLTDEKAATQTHSKSQEQADNKPSVPEPTQPAKAAPPVAVASKSSSKIAAAAKSQGNFIIQVASFSASKDAEHLKALLTLKGYAVVVTPVNNPNGMWYRVVVGPYANRAVAQKAQVVLARTERLQGMVRATTL